MQIVLAILLAIIAAILFLSKKAITNDVLERAANAGGVVAAVAAIIVLAFYTSTIVSSKEEQASKAITVASLGQEQIRVLEPTDLSPATCSDLHDFLDVYTFAIINNDTQRSFSMYKLDTKFKIGDIALPNDDLSSAPEYLLSFPVSKSIFIPLSEQSLFDKPKVFTYLNGYTYEQDSLLSPCSPESTINLPIAFPPQSTTTLKIGILFDYTDTRNGDIQPGEFWYAPISYVLKQKSFIYKFSDGNIITIDLP